MEALVNSNKWANNNEQASDLSIYKHMWKKQNQQYAKINLTVSKIFIHKLKSFIKIQSTY